MEEDAGTKIERGDRVELSSTDQWQGRVAELDIANQAFVDGEYRDALSGETFSAINPATGAELAAVASCDAGDVDAAVAAARRAYESGCWADMAPTDRKRILREFAGLIHANCEELGLLISLEMGKVIGDAVGIEVPLAGSVMEWQAEVVDKLYGEVAPTGPDDVAFITREPVGVVGAIVPWNFPINLAVSRIAPALAAGNSVVLKPAEQSPLSALLLARLGSEAGLPDGVLNVLPGYGERAGKALALHDDVDCIAFTGSTEVGKLLLKYAGESNMKRVWLECGGKSPNIIFADCQSTEAAANFAAMGIFWNQGEVCSANSRLLVQREISNEMVGLMSERASGVKLGDPLDPETTMGPLVDSAHTEKVLGYIKEGKTSATLVTGGERVDRGASDCFVAPTIFNAVPSEAKIAQEEIFGPVLSVIPFDGEADAIRIANDSVYGLGASVWTTDLSRAHRLARRLRVGTVSVNTVDAYSVLTPFGGVKQSGTSRDHSQHAIEHYSNIKTTWIKLWSG